jgi:hypothetical protein
MDKVLDFLFVGRMHGMGEAECQALVKGTPKRWASLPWPR